ncbi:conserved protein of unknown function (plasmid) [Rhodovastum atsumiense]|uniref:Uncharacterized protein n=1 Tax=Rhodovastum atsumiense TaxID=504468 RepID=A0A5M6IMV1_9PROT|nr:hypothetical protein [Rhodovastum atsumiense]KAA5609590.1 hypothetical protein F1189_23485 [Rhodovastum atsumiense]CAH2606356.1 conserved protein of unknown function [Rhodovastum atsumiense]
MAAQGQGTAPLVVQNAALYLAFSAGSSHSGARRLLLSHIIKPPHLEELYEPPEKWPSLCRELLFANSLDVCGIPAQRHPFLPPGKSDIAPASAHAIRSTIRYLKLGDGIEVVRDLNTNAPRGNFILFGGPVNNRYSRAILGTGWESPLFQLGREKWLGPPIRFDITSFSEEKNSSEVRWPLIIKDQVYAGPGEFLLITSIPDPRAPLARIVNLAGRGPQGVMAVEHFVRNEAILEKLLKSVRHMTAWQALLRVSLSSDGSPSVLDMEAVYEIGYDFSNLQREMKSVRYLDEPNVIEFNGFFGLVRPWIDDAPISVPGMKKGQKTPPVPSTERNELRRAFHTLAFLMAKRTGVPVSVIGSGIEKGIVAVCAEHGVTFTGFLGEKQEAARGLPMPDDQTPHSDTGYDSGASKKAESLPPLPPGLEWPQETYRECRKLHGWRIVTFLEKCWLPLIEAGVPISLSIVRKVDPTAAVAISNYRNPVTHKRGDLPSHLDIPVRREVTDRRIKESGVTADPTLVRTVINRLKRGKKVPGM